LAIGRAGVFVDIRGLTRTLEGSADAVKESTEASLLRIGEEMVQGAKEIVPVDTGRLQASIEIKGISEGTVIVGSDVPYAAAVEYGTYKQEASPFLAPQLDRMLTQGPQIVQQELSKRMPR
jgi:HK97 gp10 family phage protein